MTWIDWTFVGLFYIGIGIAVCGYMVTVKGYRSLIRDWLVGVAAWPLVLWACD